MRVEYLAEKKKEEEAGCVNGATNPLKPGEELKVPCKNPRQGDA